MKIVFLVLLACLAPALGAATDEDNLTGFIKGRVLEGHEGPVYKVAFLKGNRHRLVSLGHDDRSIRLWQPVIGELLSEAVFGYRPTDMIVADEGGHIDVAITTGKIVRVAIDGDTLAVQDGVSDYVGSYGRMAVSPDGRFYAVVSRNADVTVWNPRTRRIHQSYHGTEDYRVVTYTNDSNVFMAADRENGLVMWDVAANEGFGEKQGFTVPGDPVGLVPQSMAYHTGTSRMAMTHLDGRMSLWQTGPGLQARHERTMRLPRTVFEPVFSPRGKLLFVTSMDGNIYLFETDTGRLIRGFTSDQNGLFSLALNERANLMAAGTLDGKVVVWWISQ